LKTIPNGHYPSSDELCAYFRGDYLIRCGAGDINRECIARGSLAVGDRLRSAEAVLSLRKPSVAEGRRQADKAAAPLATKTAAVRIRLMGSQPVLGNFNGGDGDAFIVKIK
jgi:hypothetical protein